MNNETVWFAIRELASKGISESIRNGGKPKFLVDANKLKKQFDLPSPCLALLEKWNAAEPHPFSNIRLSYPSPGDESHIAFIR